MPWLSARRAASVEWYFTMALATLGRSPGRGRRWSAVARHRWHRARRPSAPTAWRCWGSGGWTGRTDCAAARSRWPHTAMSLQRHAEGRQRYPAAGGRHSISMRHPLPMFCLPPMTQSSGMNTSSPCTGPFMKAPFIGLWRAPMRRPVRHRDQRTGDAQFLRARGPGRVDGVESEADDRGNRCQCDVALGEGQREAGVMAPFHSRCVSTPTSGIAAASEPA